MDRSTAIDVLQAAPYVHLAAARPTGAPVIRTLHAIVMDGAVYFHGAPAGEKTELLGQAAVISCEEMIAELPSYFVDPERACPATTLYRSVQVHGTIERVDDASMKAIVLQKLMERYQPEGGHVPITSEHPLYENAVRGIMILRISLDDIDGKAKLAQNRTPTEVTTILENLWRRGHPRDARAVDLIVGANPSAPTPGFLSAPAGVRMRCALDASHVDDAVQLLKDTYWNIDVPQERIARALLGSTAWVGAVDEVGHLVACARATSDGAKWASVFDVIVASAWRGRGVGRAVMRLLLDHPQVRNTSKVWLRTRDAQRLYTSFGFVEKPVSGNVEMLLVR